MNKLSALALLLFLLGFPGLEKAQAAYKRDAALITLDSPAAPLCSGAQRSYYLRLKNEGTDTLYYIELAWKIAGRPQDSLAWAGRLLPGKELSLFLDTATLTYPGSYTFSAYIFAVQGKPDENSGNDTLRNLLTPSALPKRNGISYTHGMGWKVEFDPHDTVPLKYHWDFGEGKTDTTAKPTHQYVSGGRHLVLLTRTNAVGCSSVDTTLYYLFIGGLSERSANEWQLNASPNPFSDRLIISYALSPKAQVSAAILDAKGRRQQLLPVQWQNAGPQKLALSLPDLAPGVYLLELQAGKERRVIRVVKE